MESTASEGGKLDMQGLERRLTDFETRWASREVARDQQRQTQQPRHLLRAGCLRAMIGR